jgi:hypothetical protein
MGSDQVPYACSSTYPSIEPAPSSTAPVWLPGDVEVQIAGESFHTRAIQAAQFEGSLGGGITAVLRTEPENPHSDHAVAVHLRGRHAGYIPHAISGQVHAALVAFAAANNGRTVACPADVHTHDVGPQVILRLNPAPLGLSAELFDTTPDLARVLGGLLHCLDVPVPPHTEPEADGLLLLAEAQEACQRAGDDFDRGPRTWPRVEQAFRLAAGALSAKAGPAASRAWLGIAHARRFQRGRRDDTLIAYVEALRLDRAHTEAWCQLLDYASVAPHVPTLRELFARASQVCRPPMLHRLLAMSHQADRFARLTPAQGERLRAALLTLAHSDGDDVCVALLYADEGMRAEKSDRLSDAVTAWRRAVLAGSTDPRLADRLSVWLTKNRHYAEAEALLDRALREPPENNALRERLTRRLARCRRAVIAGPLAAEND